MALSRRSFGSNSVFVSLVLSLLVAGCGVDVGGIADPGDTGDAGDPKAEPAPFYSPAAGVLAFSSRYVSGAACGEIRGTLPGIGWDKGLDISGEGGYMTVALTVAAGTYEVSYLGRQDCDDLASPAAWAQYGGQEQLVHMTSEARSYLYCNWWDAANRVVVGIDNPSCGIRFSVDSAGNVSPAGTMGNFPQ